MKNNYYSDDDNGYSVDPNLPMMKKENDNDEMPDDDLMTLMFNDIMPTGIPGGILCLLIVGIREGDGILGRKILCQFLVLLLIIDTKQAW